MASIMSVTPRCAKRAAFEQPDAVLRAVERTHLGFMDTEWRTGHPALVIFERHQQGAGSRRSESGEMSGVGGAQPGRECDQRRPVEDRGDLAERTPIEIEHVPAEQLERATSMARESPRWLADGLEPGFLEECAHRKPGQLDADHPVALCSEPVQIGTLAGQRYEHARTAREPERGPVAHEARMRL